MENLEEYFKKYNVKKYDDEISYSHDIGKYVIRYTQEPLTGIFHYMKCIYILNNGIIQNINGPCIIYESGKLEYRTDRINFGVNLSNKQFKQIKQKVKEAIFK